MGFFAALTLPLKLAVVVGGLVVAGGLGIGIFWAIDGEVGAEVVDIDCPPTVLAGGEGSVTVKTNWFGVKHTVKGIDPQACLHLEKGDYIEYHVRSEHTILYEAKGGACKWDSEVGVPC